MKLYIRPIAPNAVKVMIFVAERGVSIETIDVEALPAEEYRRVSPLGMVPVLETDRGLRLSESLTICQYLDAIAEGPTLFGQGTDGQAIIAMWERRAELMLMNPAIEYGHHTQPFLADRLRQFPDFAKAHVAATAPRMIAAMEQKLAESRFLAGEAFTMADITAFLGYFGLLAYGAVPPSGSPSILRWQSEIGARPSMAPLHALAAEFGLNPPAPAQAALNVSANPFMQ
jgi:glutathione S-transferase